MRKKANIKVTPRRRETQDNNNVCNVFQGHGKPGKRKSRKTKNQESEKPGKLEKLGKTWTNQKT